MNQHYFKNKTRHGISVWVSTVWLACLLSLNASVARAAAPDDREVLQRTRQLIEEVRRAAFPELRGVAIEVRLLTADADYFRTRFTLTSFFFCLRLRYVVLVNRRLYEQPVAEDALRAVIAHELGHVIYFQARRRLQLLGLVRLATPGFTARFERATDLQAIARAYGAGLKAYRLWLYQHIPAAKLAEKKRNYFSPEEIDALLSQLHQHPEKLRTWLAQPPRSLLEIERNQ